MKKVALTALLIALAGIAGCGKEPEQSASPNKAGLTEDTYAPSNVVVGPMTFPGNKQTVFKQGSMFKEPRLPQPWQQPKTWMVYMAAPGWTNGGEKIGSRLSADATQIWHVKDFIERNGLRDKVKVAWLQYDPNPSELYVESYAKIPDNFIPLFLKLSGPQVDFYIHSPATRFGPSGGPSMRYDLWLKQYLPWAKKEGDDYVATTREGRENGFNEPDGQYWDQWARHWFIVNPDGQVVDAWFSNIGRMKVYAADKPINSLIHHLKLGDEGLDIPEILVTRRPWDHNYRSLYTAPLWDQLSSDVRGAMGMP